MTHGIRIVALVALVLLAGERSFPQTKPQRQRDLPHDQMIPQFSRDQLEKEEYRKVFDTVREGFATGGVGLITEHLGTNVQMNLGGEEAGYYSASQARYLLEDHFRTNKVVTLSLDDIRDSETNPYATGTIEMNVNGIREHFRVYVSLSRSEGRWLITQINIY